ncbi:hypothetical protein BKA69DRAFT_1166267 [Paraphysoderma sedebokerense]|nr:hypothetical protein BKA69DRAFT_1166267 [Paraphysoderma sedebokerense]
MDFSINLPINRPPIRRTYARKKPATESTDSTDQTESNSTKLLSSYSHFFSPSSLQNSPSPDVDTDENVTPDSSSSFVSKSRDSFISSQTEEQRDKDTNNTKINTVQKPKRRKLDSSQFQNRGPLDKFIQIKSSNVSSSVSAASLNPSSTLSEISSQKRPAISNKSKSKEAMQSGSSTSQSDARKPTKFQQLYLDFGQKNQGPISCSECGMSFRRGHEEDEKLHNRHHKAVVGGVDWPGYKTEDVVIEFNNDTKMPSGAITDRIVEVSSQSGSFEKKKLRVVIDTLTTELGSVPLDDAALSKFKAYLYISEADKKCVGCVLVESIKFGYLTLPPESSEISKSIVSLSESEPNINQNDLRTNGNAEERRENLRIDLNKKVSAVVGISRIWVSRSSRRQNIATKLLDAVRYLFPLNLRVSAIIMPSFLYFSHYYFIFTMFWYLYFLTACTIFFLDFPPPLNWNFSTVKIQVRLWL